jgi:hypothetical protein
VEAWVQPRSSPPSVGMIAYSTASFEPEDWPLMECPKEQGMVK